MYNVGLELVSISRDAGTREVYSRCVGSSYSRLIGVGLENVNVPYERLFVYFMTPDSSSLPLRSLVSEDVRKEERE